MNELPPGWVEAALGEIAETALGKMLSAAARSRTNPRPYLRNKNVQWGRFDLVDVLEMDFLEDQLERFEVRPGDLLVCEGGEVGRAAIWRGQLHWVGYQKALHRVRPLDGVVVEYLMYVLGWYAQRNAFDPFVTGSTIKHLPQEDFRLLPVPLPSSSQQRRIVAAIEEQFSRLDAAEASLRHAQRNLERARAATLEGAFSDPRTVELREISSSMRYGTSTKCSHQRTETPVLRIPNVKDGRVDVSDLKYAPSGDVDLSSHLLEPGDLLVVRTNGSKELIGRVAPYLRTEPMAFASYLIRIRLDQSVASPEWVSLALATPSIRGLIEARAATTAGQYNLNLQALRTLPIPLPSLDEQRRIVAEVERQLSILDATKAAIDRALKRSKALRRAILERAFTGRLVPQDPSDEPASVLLERIRAERATVTPRRRAPSRRRATLAAQPSLPDVVGEPNAN